MADHEFTLSKLSVNFSRSNEGANRKTAIVVNFTAADETWEITLPPMLHDELRHLISQFQREISNEREAALLSGSDNFTVVLL